MADKPEWLIGRQEPTMQNVPLGSREFAENALEFVKWAGLDLYPWQKDLLRDTLLQNDEGLWSSSEVVVSLSRQNGKGTYLVALELVAVYLCGATSIMHSAHFLDTAMDARDRLWDVIESHEGLMTWWEEEFPGQRPKPVMGNGKDAIKFPGKAKIYFRTRTKKTGRGLSIDLLIFDECFDLPIEVFAAMNSVTKARPNAQKVFISSPVNRFEHMHGAVFSAKRWAGVDGDPGVLFKEWSVDPEVDDPFDPETWPKANPSLVSEPRPGVQLAEVQADAFAAKKSQDLKDVFLVETLGVGNWVPRDDDDSDFEPVLNLDDWEQRADLAPQVVGDSAVAVDITPDGVMVGMVAAMRTSGGGIHLSRSPLDQFDMEETVSAVRRAVDQNDPVAVVLDPAGPASTLQRPLEKVGIAPELMSARKVVAATELFLQMFREGKLTHDGDPRWLDELGVAEFRQIGEIGRALTRKAGSVVGLVAATFAVWAATEFAPIVPQVAVKTDRIVVHGAPVGVVPSRGAKQSVSSGARRPGQWV